MRVAIVGSRSWVLPMRTRSVVDEYLRAAAEHARAAGQELTIVTGYDPIRKLPHGVDEWAYESAVRYGIDVVCHPAEWDGPHGKGAGFARNQRIVSGCDRIVAFWNGESNGTRDTIDRALKSRKPIMVNFP